MASLRKRLKSDNWVCCYATADGRRTQRSTGTTDKDEAMAICRRWENEEYAMRDEGEPVEGLAVANKRALVAGMVSMVVVVLSLIGYWQYDLYKNGPELFVDVPASERPATFFESNLAKRHRWVNLSPDALERLNTLGGKIRLNLFDDLQVTTEVVVHRFIHGGSETSVGRLDNDPDTLMMMCRQTTQPGKLMGVVVDTFGTQYLISHEMDGKHVIVEVDQSKIPGCGGVIELEQAKQPVKTAATKSQKSASPMAAQSSAEAKALQRMVRGSEAAALLDPNGHTHRAGTVCTDCRSFTELKKRFKQAELNQIPKTGALAPIPPRESPATEPVKTSSHNLLNSMGFNKPLLATINPSNKSFGLWGRGGSAVQSVGPASPGVLEHLRGGDTEYIDILFIYTDDLLQAQAGANASEKLNNLNLSTIRTVELTNTIFSQCHIPLEIRMADLTLARSRAMSGGDATLAQNGGPGGPAWEEVQAPVRPVWDPAATPPAWSKHWNNGAKVGIYRPKYENYNPGDLGAALSWIGDTSNSLIYGDQYWGSGIFASTPPAQRPYINLPSTLTWTIVPEYDNSGTPADDAVTFTFNSTRTPELNTGPVEDAGSSHALDDSYAVGSPTGNMGAATSHAPVQQYNDITGPTPGPVLVDDDTDQLEWIGGAEHGLATGSVVHFSSWTTPPDANGSKRPKWKAYQQPVKNTKVKVEAAEGGSNDSGDDPVRPGNPGTAQAPGSPVAMQRADVIKGVVEYPIVAGLFGVVTEAQHYPGIDLGKGKVHPMIESGRASYWRLNFLGKTAEPEKSARAFLSAMAGQLKMKQDTSDLQTLQVKHGFGTAHTRFQQTVRGIPVYGAFLTVNQGTDGAINTLHTKYHASLNVPAEARPRLSLTAAKGAAYRKGGVKRPRMPGSGKLVWWPDEHGNAKLAWEVTVCAMKPLGDFHTVVDAETGEVMLQENRICFATVSGSGFVFKPNPYQVNGGDVNGTLVDNADNNSTQLDSLMNNVTLPRLTAGLGYLTGTYADLVRLNSGSLPDNDAFEVSRAYNYSRNDLRFEQPTIYYTIDRIANYFVSLGFSASNTPPNGIRDANATWACSQWNTVDQSFFSPANNTLHFGTGGVDDGEDGDIVAHEYGHAVQGDQNINWAGGEMGAMGEGFGDYLAASIFANDGDSLYQTYHAPAVGEWDAVVYDPSFDNSLDVSRGKIKTIMGDGTQFIDNNASALSNDVQLVNIGDFVIEPTASQKIYFTDNNGSSVRRMDHNATFDTTVDVNSSFTRLAGGGAQNPDANASAANVALQQSLGTLGAIDLNSTEGVFFVDKNSTGSCRIRRIDTNGSLTTVIGGGAGDPTSITTNPVNAPLATSLSFSAIDDIAFDDLNRLYICQRTSQRVWRLESNGTMILFGGGGLLQLDGLTASNSNFGGVQNLATRTVGLNRFVYLDTNTTLNGVRIRRIAVDDNPTLRLVTTVAGSGLIGNDPDANSSNPVTAISCRLTDVDGMRFDSSGRLYFGDGSAQRVRRVDVAGIITTVSGGGSNDTGDGNSTSAAMIGPVKTIGVDGNLQVYSLGSTPLGGLRLRKSYGGPPIDPPNMRRVDGNKMYPADLVGEVHADGEIWSRALWDIRKAILASDGNASIADRLILQHHFGLPGGSTMRTAAVAINNADLSLYAGAHTASIQKAFNDRGITVSGDYSTGLGINIVLNTDYYVRRESATQFSLYLSWNEALKNKNKIDFNGTGFGIHMTRGSVADLAYGQAFDPTYGGVLGTNGVDVGALRMDLNGAGGQRYPNLHGAYGDFEMGYISTRADLVCILTENLTGPAAGLALKLTDRGTNPPRDLFTNTTRPDDVDFNSSEVIRHRDSIRNLSLQGQYMTGGYTFQHELGHVLGAAHGLGDVGAGSLPGTPGLHPHDGGITFSPYAYTNSNGVADTFLAVGNHFMSWGSQGFGTKYCTIMAYTSTRGSTQIPLYSSPIAFWRGEPTGRLRGMYLPPPLSSYSQPLYMDNAQCISATGHLSAFYRDSNGSGRAPSRTSVRPEPPKGLPGERPVNYSRNPSQANAKGGNSGTAAAGAPTQVGPGGAANPGGGLGGATNPTTTTNRPGIPLGGGSNPTLPVIPPGGGLGGTNNPGGGLGGTTNNPTVLPINPAVPNDHRYSATKWNGGRWANNNTTFATVINGHNNGATHENAERGHRAFHGKSVWWYIEWPATAAAITLKQLTASTKGSTFDTTLGVMYVAKGQAATQVPLNNQYFKWNNNAPGGGGPFSTVILPQVRLNPGDRIYFMVDGVGGTSGKVRLGVKMTK